MITSYISPSQCSNAFPPFIYCMVNVCDYLFKSMLICVCSCAVMVPVKIYTYFLGQKISVLEFI